MRQRTFILGVLIYGVLAILALVYHLERTCFLDSSFILFNILKEGSHAVQVNRFGSICTQIFPLISCKLGLPLAAICKIYSVGFILYYFTCFTLCTKVFKQHKLGLCLLLFNTLMVVHSFYWIMNELIQGMAFLIVFLAMATYASEKESTPIWYRPFNALMLFTLAFFHPLILFPFFFASLYFFYFKSIDRNEIVKNGLLFFGFYLLKHFFFGSGYDSQAMNGLKNFVTLFPNYFTLESNYNFLSYLIKDYFLLIPCLLLIIYWFVKEKAILPLAFILTSFFGYLLIINISYPDGPQQFYIESLYLPLSFFLIVPLVYNILPKVKEQYALIALTIVLGFKCIQIGFAHEEYSERLTYQRQLLKESENDPIKKIILPQNKVNMEILKMHWGSPYEFWLLSTLDNNVSRSVVISDDPGSLSWALSKKESFVTEWGVYDYPVFPKKYFIFQDTSKYELRY